MLALIAESKTMTPCDTPVDPEVCARHRPASDIEAGAIMQALRSMPPAELAERTRLSAQMVKRLAGMIYEFPNKALGDMAIEAFTGVVFKAFGYRTLDAAAQAETCRRVRIISSLYGWLRPDDIIKAYRFDFTTPLAPGGLKFAAYWRADVTRRLINEITLGGIRDVLDLMPGDAARCIDMKAVSAHARVCKVDFREIVDGTTTRTPHAGRLKTLRGTLLRLIVTGGITSAEELCSLSTDSFVASPDSTPGHIIFETA